MTHEDQIQGELKLILHRIEELSKNQDNSFAEVKSRISSIEGDLRSNAVWMGKTEQRLDHIETSLTEDSETSSHGLIKIALTTLGTALAGAIGAIVTLVSKGGL